MKLFIYLFIALFIFNACSSIKNINLDTVKNTAINAILPIEQDKQLGLQAVEQINNDPTNYPILDEQKYPFAYQEIRRITNVILNSGQVQNKDKFAWETRIIKNDTVLNAFCTPGGYIYVYTGLIKYLDNETQLAGVLGHEIAHADRRHSAKQMTEQYGVNVLVDLLIKKDNQKQLAQIGTQLISLQFSRSDETDADTYSVKYLYPTQYDARGAKYFFEKISSGSPKPSFLEKFTSTHPAPTDRVKNIETQWEKLGGKVGNTFVNEYQKLKNSLP